MKDKVKIHKLKVPDVPMKPTPSAKDYYYPVVPVNWTQELGKMNPMLSVWLTAAAVGLIPVVLFGSGAFFKPSMDEDSAIRSAWIVTIIFFAAFSVLMVLVTRKESKVFKLRTELSNENIKGFVSWLKARYNIVYDSTAERDQNWLYEVTSYSYVGDRATFKDAYGNQFVLGKYRGKLRVMDMKTLKEKAVIGQSRKRRWV